MCIAHIHWEMFQISRKGKFAAILKCWNKFVFNNHISLRLYVKLHKIIYWIKIWRYKSSKRCKSKPKTRPCIRSNYHLMRDFWRSKHAWNTCYIFNFHDYCIEDCLYSIFFVSICNHQLALLVFFSRLRWVIQIY